MLDLKAKLASAGLVTPEDIERAEKAKAKERASARHGRGSSGGGSRARSQTAGLPVKALQGKPKAEVYEAVRRWIERVRLDAAGGIPGEDTKPYHFPEATGRIGRLMLDPRVVARLEAGEAGVVAFMSNHGLAHAVVPAEGARAIGELQPMWLRVLAGDARAGKIEPKAP